MIKLTDNEFGAIFVEVDGVLVADSTCINRKRGFWNKLTQTYVPARDFTRTRIRKSPRQMVAKYFAKTGYVAPAGSRVVIDFRY